MQPISSALQTLVDSDYRHNIGRVRVYDTTKTVPSKGFNLSLFGLSPTSTITGTWYSGLSSTYPADSVTEGTYLDGSSKTEPSTVIAFDWGVGGAPGPITRSDLWGARWYGHFFARYSGVYRFFIDSSPFSRVQIRFNSSVLTLKDEDAASVDRWGTDVQGTDAVNTRKELYADTASLTAGTWYTISVEFRVPQLLAPTNIPSYLCVKYREPGWNDGSPAVATTSLNEFDESGGNIVTDYESDNLKKTLSAGVVNTTGAFLAGTAITNFKGFTGSKRAGEMGEYSFNMSLPVSTNLATAISSAASPATITVDSAVGFPTSGALLIGTDTITYTGKTEGSTPQFTGCGWDGGGADSTYAVDVPVNQQTGLGKGYDPLTGEFGDLKPFRLVRIEGGLYDKSGTTEYFTDRIWGNIYPGPTINRQNKMATINVKDFGWGLMRTYERNYPDQASYSMAGYYDEQTVNEPEGLLRPIAYDRWKAEYAMRDLLIRGGVDPIWTYGRNRYQITTAYASSYGQYLLQGEQRLDSKRNYGYPGRVDEQSPDERYIWAFGYGTFLFEALQEVVRTFGHQYIFTSNGYARILPHGHPDNEYVPGDTELTFSGAGWATAVDDINAFKGKYRANSTSGDKVTMAATYFNDIEIVLVRHAVAALKIKIKIGAAYIQSIIVDGATIAASSDIFTIPALTSGTWYFYDGISPSSGYNSSVIQMGSLESYGSQAVEVEVAASSGEVRFNSIFVYKRSARTTLRALTDANMLDLKMEIDATNQRNEVDVVGARRGVVSDELGDIINPQNPVYIHTVSRALDTNAMYDEDDKNYSGRVLPMEVFDERVFDQERADFIAVHALTRFRSMVATGSTQILFDPQIEPMDSLSITDEHSRILDASQVWIKSISESLEVYDDGSVSYLTNFNEIDPREPMPSMRSKPAMVLSDWNDEPIINIEIHYRGKRISGNDATYNSTTRVVTIGTSPSWTTNMWADYYYSDKNGIEHKIASNTGDALTLDTADTVTAGNWSITFDPLDTDKLGAPIVIHYDQTVQAKVKVSITNGQRRIIADLNKDQQDIWSDWGASKTIPWSGEIHYGAKEGRTNYYVSRHTLSHWVMPLIILFRVTYMSGNEEKTIYIQSHSSGYDRESPSADILMDGASTVENTYGACKITPRILDQGYYIGVSAKGNQIDGTILTAGRVWKYANTAGATYRLFIEGPTDFTANEHDGLYLVCGRTGIRVLIDDSGPSTTDGLLSYDAETAAFTVGATLTGGTSSATGVIVAVEDRDTEGVLWLSSVTGTFQDNETITDDGTPGSATSDGTLQGSYVDVSPGSTAAETLSRLKASGFSGVWCSWKGGHPYNTLNELTYYDDAGDYPWVKIVTTYEGRYFQTGDNAGRGLRLNFSTHDFYVETLHDKIFDTSNITNAYLSASIGGRFVASSNLIKAPYYIILNESITVNYEGTPYTIPAGTRIKHAQLGQVYQSDVVDYTSVDPRTDEFLIGWGLQIYWSKYNTDRLYFSCGISPDAHDPNQGVFSLATIISDGTINSDGFVVKPSALNVTSKSQSFIMAASLEIHQFSMVDEGTIPGRLDPWDGRRDEDDIITITGVKSTRLENIINYNDFRNIIDMDLYFNPSNYQIVSGTPLVFNQRFADGAISDITAWHFLFKLSIIDRVGRTPNNMPIRYNPIADGSAISQDEDNVSALTLGDYDGISAFWDPAGSYTIVDLFPWAWLQNEILRDQLNIARAIRPVGWK